MNSILGVSDRHSTESCKNPVRRRSLNHEVSGKAGEELGSRSANANAIWPKFIPRRAENCVTSKTLTPPASLLGKKDCVLDPSSEVVANNEAMQRQPLSFFLAFSHNRERARVDVDVGKGRRGGRGGRE